MKKNVINQFSFTVPIIITAGSIYLDIDAYACCVAMAELLQQKGENAPVAKMVYAADLGSAAAARQIFKDRKSAPAALRRKWNRSRSVLPKSMCC